MAKITVKFYSLWNLYLNTNSVTLEINNIDEAMEKLEVLYGEELRKKSHNNKLQYKNIKDSSTILINGVSIRNNLNKPLTDGDLIQIFPPIAGG